MATNEELIAARKRTREISAKYRGGDVPRSELEAAIAEEQAIEDAVFSEIAREASARWDAAHRVPPVDL